MGTGTSVAVKSLKANPGCSVGEVIDKENEYVQVCGQVAHNGRLMETPFGQLHGVAIRITTGRNKKYAGLFVAERVISFSLVGGGRSLEVEGGDGWELALNSSHTEMNILRDDKRADRSAPTMQLKSGGTVWNQREMPPLTVKPNASDWWQTFNGGVDSMPGSGVKGQAPRGAREFVLKPGDVCAVRGELRRGKICMGAGKGRGCITNNTSVAPWLRNASTTSDIDTGRQAEVIPMHLA